MQAPARAGENFRGAEARVILLPAQAGNCSSKARGFSPVKSVSIQFLIIAEAQGLEELIALSINAKDYDALKSWQLASWCRKHGADEWTLTAMSLKGPKEAAWLESFDEATKPFRLPTAKRRSLTAQRPISQGDFIKPTELWRLNTASFAVLQEVLPEGLFHYQVEKGSWLEYPVLYRRGEFMLGVVSHEHEGIVRVTNTERHTLEAEGFVSRPRGLYVGY